PLTGTCTLRASAGTVARRTARPKRSSRIDPTLVPGRRHRRKGVKPDSSVREAFRWCCALASASARSRRENTLSAGAGGWDGRGERTVVVRVLVVIALLAASGSLAIASSSDDDGVYLLLKLRERRLYLMDGPRRPARSFPVAVGRPEYATPVGHFEVTEKVID